MTKADALWKKYARNGLTEIGKVDFLAALQEYGEAVRAEAVGVCNNERLVDSTGLAVDIAYDCAVNDCAAAIEKMKLP